jgi:hypothetical protein
MRLPATAEGFRLRAAIARDQTRHWGRLFWQPAPTRRELDRRERLWFWWGGVGFFAEVQARTLATEKARSVERER